MKQGTPFKSTLLAVDEFQHEIYENPDWTPEQREACWSKIEKIYLPHRNYDDLEMLKKGGLWYGQNHIFVSPFYYIDYVLAQICAFQFWQWDNKDHDAAWKSYLELCREGGSKPFLELVKIAKLQSPFEEQVVADATQAASAWLKTVDDTKF